MPENLHDQFERIKQSLLETRHAIEEAEAKVERFNEVIHQVGAAGIVPREVFLGKAVTQPYDSESDRVDTGLVFQAALLIPEGLGVCQFDSETHRELSESYGGVKSEARLRFVPFSECEPGEKAFLNAQIRDLSTKFIRFVNEWNLMRMLEGVNDDNIHQEQDTGPAVGQEEW